MASRFPPAGNGTRAPSALDIGRHFFQAGQLSQAEAALKHAPESAETLLLLALIAAQSGRIDHAGTLLERCLVLDPGHVDAHNNLGNVHLSRGRLAQAAEHYRKAAELAPDYPLPQYNLGNALRFMGKLEPAIAAYRQALALDPRYTEARVNLSISLRENEEYEEAETLCRELVSQHPDAPDLYLNLGNVLRQRGKLAEAREAYRQLLDAAPEHPRGRLSMALLLLAEHELDRADALLADVGSAGGLPEAELFAAQAEIKAARNETGEALRLAMDSIEKGMHTARQYYTAANLLAELGRRELALDVLGKSKALFGERPSAFLGLQVTNQRYLCDWTDLDARQNRLRDYVRDTPHPRLNPFSSLAQPGLSPADLQKCARAHATTMAAWYQRRLAPLPIVPRPPGQRIRIGYLSGNLREHPTSFLVASVFELHDRSRFETFAYSCGPTVDAPVVRRLRAAFDHFDDVATLSHQQIAQRIREHGIDILVDIDGHTSHARTQVAALRPAPVQVNWLGFPGTLGAPFIDYLIADETVTPRDQAPYYDEHLAYLPDTYFPVDFRREVAAPPTRAAEGLPDDAFVLCCFNNSYKITPAVFDIWCDLLREIPNAWLWLFADNDVVARNLTREADQRGIDGARIVFASRRPQAEHLARIALADVFLDTLPYNAHTTASDALWMGVPVITCPGETFPSRVAASLLHACRLPELVMSDLAAYKAEVLRLANDRAALDALKGKLAQARQNAPYFDTGRYTRNLEALYVKMFERHQNGLPPAMLDLRD